MSSRRVDRWTTGGIHPFSTRGLDYRKSTGGPPVARLRTARALPRSIPESASRRRTDRFARSVPIRTVAALHIAWATRLDRSRSAASKRGLALLSLRYLAHLRGFAHVHAGSPPVAPNHPAATHALLRALEDTNQIPEALALVHNLIAHSPDDVLAHTRLSILLQKSGDIPAAEAASARARILDWKRQLNSSIQFPED